MKSFWRVALLAMATASVARAQQGSTVATPSDVNLVVGSTSLSSDSVPSPSVFLLTPAGPRPTGTFTSMNAASPANAFSLATAPSTSDAGWPAETAEATPAAPEPKYVYGSRDDFRFQLALGVLLLRFRSPFYYATGVGTNTSITYFTNNWVGIEGSVNTAFAPTIRAGEHVKYASYGAGPKIAWRGRKLEPWAHAIFGGAHILPQVADQSQNGFCMNFGGGVDYRIFPHLSARLGADYVKTHFFGLWENNAQAYLDVVLHF